MAVTYNFIDIRGVAAEPIFEEIMFENNTIANNLVTFEEGVKAETIFTETSASAVMQPWVCGEPTSAGDLNLFDTLVTPIKAMYYMEWCPDTFRFSRFKRDMKPGAWNTMSAEEDRVLMSQYGKKISLDLEQKFWSNITPATKTAIAALTAGAANNQVSAQEKTLAAATQSTAPFGLFDGVIQKMIYNSSNPTQTAGVGQRIKVVGTTVTSANIKAEYEKIYAAIPAEVLASGEMPYIYAPYSHKAMINIANNVNTNYTKPFDVTGDSYKFYGLEIKFVPFPENVALAAPKINIIWTTDLLSDANELKIDRIANNREDWFIKAVITIKPHIANQKYNVLYVG